MAKRANTPQDMLNHAISILAEHGYQFGDEVNKFYDRDADIIARQAQNRTAIMELIDDHALIKAWLDESDADQDDINDYLDLFEADGVVGGNFGIAAGAAVTLTGSGFIIYRINGVLYYCDLDTTISLTDDGDVDTGKWRSWRIEIDRSGTVTATADGDTQHDNEQDALLNLSMIAPTADTVTIGYFDINSDGGFAVGDVNVNGETAENVYIVRGPKNQVSGLNAALGASVEADTGAATWSSGTVNVNRNGLKLTEIAAIANQAMDDADVISTLKAGGWLLVTDLAGTGVYALAADGNAGAASTMAYDTTVLADAAIDTLADQLPELFVPIGKIVVDNQTVGDFTAGTTHWDATSVTSVATDATLGVWDRTGNTGFDSHKINPPAVPASIAASLLATLAAADPTAITAAAPTDPATLFADL